MHIEVEKVDEIILLLLINYECERHKGETICNICILLRGNKPGYGIV
jgi:hypothetical protein